MAAPEVIAKSYGLTPTELRVLLAIVEEDGVPEVAEVLGIATQTVKPTSVVSIRRPARLVSSILPRSSLDFQIRYSSRLPQSEGSASRLVDLAKTLARYRTSCSLSHSR
jgi:hypothetical protein